MLRPTTETTVCPFERRDNDRQDLFAAHGDRRAYDKLILDEDDFGGLFDTYGFPAIMALASICLATILGWAVSNTYPYLIADHFMSLFVGSAAATALPLAIVAGIRERRKWRSHRALRSIASLDPLTGLMNRRSFSVSMQEELNRMTRTGHVAAVILFDLDHFKHLNDHHGHHVGDEMLTSIASIAYSELRNPFDRLARWGGEEFIILLHDMTEETARGVCERLRARIESLSVENEGEMVSATASFGGSLLRPNQAFSEALYNADTALYDAKSNGRNRVEFTRCMTVAN